MSDSANFQVYSASAGSGKTFTLVKEYLKIVLQQKDYYYFQKILAITFTNKAATEMKERILYNLQCFARKEKTPMWSALQEETGLETSTIQNRAQKITEAIIQNYTAFSITTIDSFTHKIIRSFAYDFGLSLDFDIELDTKNLLQEAVDQTIEQIGLDPDLSEALITFSLQRSDDDKTWDIEHTLSDFAEILLNETENQAFQKISKKDFSDYKQLQKIIDTKQKANVEQLLKIGNEGLGLLKANHLSDDLFSYKMLPNFFNALQSKKEISKLFEEGKLARRFEENKLIKKTCSTQDKQAFENNFQHFFDLYLRAERLYSTHNLLLLFKDSIIPLAVLSYINNALEKIKDENNIRLITEFNDLIFKKIQKEPTPFIYERLGEKYKHYFIDEMQDTSILQWKNLAKLIENSITQEGGSLMLVGDAKQAIYRWRGGASEQFIQLSDPMDSAPFMIPKDIVSLDTNYRSFSEIIAFNNQFFKHIAQFLQNTSYKKLYLEGNQQKFNTQKGGYVQLEFYNPEEETLEKNLQIPDKVLRTIRSLENDFEQKDICIIVRKRKDAIAIANYLTEHDIPIISSETLLLSNHPKVMFLIHLLQLIRQPKDKEKAISILDFLYDTANIQTDKHHFFSQFTALSEKDFYTKLGDFGFHFNLKTFHEKSLYDAIEYSMRSFHLANSPNAYLQFFLEAVIDFQSQKGSDLVGFLDFWVVQKDKLSIHIPEGKNAVQIMTIHKAKGLQFPVVIFPYDLDIYQQVNPKIWYPIATPEIYQNFSALYIPYSKKLQFTDEQGASLFQKRREILELDNFNLLYVALTRAVEQLYIITEYKKQEKKQYFSGLYIDFLKKNNLWNTDQWVYTFGNKKREIRTETTVNNCKANPTQHIEAELFISSDIQEHKVALYTKSALLWDTDQGKAITYGNLLHEILAQIKTKDDIETTLQKLLSQGIIDTEQITHIKPKLMAIVTHPKLKAYYQQNLRIFNEREIVTQEAKNIIPDRLILYPDNSMVILDYKTGAKDSKHHQQLQEYGNILTQMGYTIIKKTLIYIGESEIDIQYVD